jgi:hypothetical protein
LDFNSFFFDSPQLDWPFPFLWCIYSEHLCVQCLTLLYMSFLSFRMCSCCCQWINYFQSSKVYHIFLGAFRPTWQQYVCTYLLHGTSGPCYQRLISGMTLGLTGIWPPSDTQCPVFLIQLSPSSRSCGRMFCGLQ